MERFTKKEKKAVDKPIVIYTMKKNKHKSLMISAKTQNNSSL